MNEKYTIKNKIAIFKHARNWSGDRCSQLLESMGYQIDWFYPQEGGPLPDPAQYRGAVVLGCRDSVNDSASWIADELRWLENCLKTDCPYLGICFGGQLLAKVLGAEVSKHKDELTEVGFTELFQNHQAGGDVTMPQKLFQWHNEGFELPANSTLLCSSERFHNQAFRYQNKNYGIQFHPEVNHSVLTQWFRINEDYESEGLDPVSRRKQLDYASQHEDAITTWFFGFLKQWLA